MADLREDTVLYIDPHSAAANIAESLSTTEGCNNFRLIEKIACRPQAIWLNTESSVSRIEILSSMSLGEEVVTVVVYFIPGRDRLGGYSSGGATDAASYKTWIRRLASAIGSLRCWVILEPDPLATAARSDDRQAEEYLALLGFGISELGRCPNVRIYLDVGHPRWLAVPEIVNILRRVNISKETGFALNVSNFILTEECITYGVNISSKLDGHHFVIDTSRHGAGPQTDVSGNIAWCNPNGRALGEPPTTRSNVPELDGLLWIKRPGESDGACNGGPPAGEFWLDYALGLAQRAHP